MRNAPCFTLLLNASRRYGDAAPAGPEAAPVATSAPVDAAPPVAAPPAAAPPIPTPTPVAQAPEVAETDEANVPPWFKERMERKERSTRKAVLKELGVATLDEARALIEQGKPPKGKPPTAATLQEPALDVEVYERIVTRAAAQQLASLTAREQQWVKNKVGADTDPAQVVLAIEELRMLREALAPEPVIVAATAPAPQPAAAPAAPPVTPAVRPPLPAGASTSAAPAAPVTLPPAATDHLAVYAEMKRRSPYAAQIYYTQNERAILAQIDVNRSQE